MTAGRLSVKHCHIYRVDTPCCRSWSIDCWILLSMIALAARLAARRLYDVFVTARNPARLLAPGVWR